MSDSDKQALLDGTATIQTEIEVHGENLFDKKNTQWVRNNNSDYQNTADNSTTRIRTQDLIKLEGGKTYTVSGIPSGITVNAIKFYANIGDTSTTSYVTTTTFTVPTNAQYVIFQFAGSNFTDETKVLMKRVDIWLEEGTFNTLTETNSVIDWNHEDFRQVKEEGFIGQFVARQLTGNLHNLADDFKITDKELILRLGARTNNNTNWYSLGNFLVTKVTDDEVNDKTSFEALDYTKKFNKAYVDRITYPCTAGDLVQDVCNQCGVELGSLTFKNSDYIINGNAFTNNESCRDVMKAIGKLAFSWVRTDWDNKVYIDFDVTPFKGNITPSQYETFGNNKYYNLKTQKEVYGPVDKVVIGYSAIDGEKTYIGEENGTCVINVLDNPLVYNQEQRASIINSANDLLGMTYTPLNTLTVGHPWLKGNELVRVTDMEGVSHDTFPLDRTIQYFGHIKTLINSTTETKTNDNLAYKPEMIKNYERSEIYNDQINKQIGIIINEQSNTSNKLNETISTLDGTIQRVSRTETNIQDIVTTTQASIGKNHLYLEDTVEGNALGYSVDGATEQQTYSGKNLFNINADFSSGTYHATRVMNENNLIITPDGGYARIEYSFPDLVAGNKYTLTAYYNNPNNNSLRIAIFNSGTEQSSTSVTTNASGNYKHTFTANADTRIRFYANTLSSTITTSMTYYNIQIEEGTTDTTYEPYVGGIPSPNPDYPQDVRTIPSIINLFDKANTQWYRNTSSAFISTGNTDTTRIRTTSFAIDGGKTYIVSGVPSGITFYRVRTFTEYGGDVVDNLTPTNNTFTLNSNIKYIHLYFSGTNFTDETNELMKNANIMLEEGSVSHEYVPYGYWSKVKVTGKNLCPTDFSNWESGDYSGTGAKRDNTARIRLRQLLRVNPSTTYYLNVFSSNDRFVLRTYDNSMNFVRSIGGIANESTITTNNNEYYLGIFIYSNTNQSRSYETYRTMFSNGDIKPLICLNSETDKSYEPYKENQVLIDMSKENLINIDTLDFENAYYSSTGTWTANNLNGLIQYISVQPSTTYTITKNITTNNVSIVEFNGSKTFIQKTMKYNTSTGGNNEITFTTTSTTQYLAISYNYDNSTNVTKTMLESWNIKLFQSNNPTPYYELCKIGDYKDTLSIDSSGNVVINKNVGKVVLNGSESIFSMGWASPKYAYAINVSNIKQTTNSNDTANLFCDYYAPHSQNDIFNTYNYSIGRRTNNGQVLIRNDDITSINSLKTWLSTHNTSVYYPLATPETINLPNTKIPLFEGINHVTFVDDLETNTSITYYRNTPLSGTYATVTQLNDVSTEKTTEIQTVKKEVLFEVNNERVRINAINETIDETGVPIVKTDTGYTFDIDGMKIEKSDNDVSTVVDNDGLATSYQGNEILTVRSNGVESENMTVRKFYVQKPIRMEKTKSISDGSSVGLGFFYVGE